MVKFEHLKLCSSGGEDGASWVGWWWKIGLDGIFTVDGLGMVGIGMDVTSRGGGCCAWRSLRNLKKGKNSVILC